MVIILIEKILWLITSSLIIVSSIYFSVKLNFVQTKISKMFKYLFKKNKDKKSITPFQSLMLVLAGRIGVGSIAGVALAIYYGGPGTIFWMWMICFLSASLTFSETVLGVHFKEKDEKHINVGGPSYYLKKGLNNKKLGNLYAILIILSYVGGFLSIQSNTITKSINELININNIYIGIIICFLTCITIFGGIKKITKVTSKLVPIMTILYITTALYISVINYDKIVDIFILILKDAFALKSVTGGILGTMVIGIQRGIFSSESGIGTGAIAASTTNSNSIEQGYVQMLGIYITTFLICTSTALIILTSNYNGVNFNDLNGIEITQYAFNYHLGNFGIIIIFLSICLFSFSTILSGYYDGEASLKYLVKNPKPYLFLLKILTIVILFFGCILSSSKLWDIVDILVALLAIINIYGIYKLKSIVINEYKKSKLHGKI